MRTPTIGSVQFSVGNPGEIRTLEDATRYIADLESRVAAALSLLAAGHDEVIYSPPAKPRDGDRRYADGTLWNPGSGRGLYRYDSVAVSWIFLG